MAFFDTSPARQAEEDLQARYVIDGGDSLNGAYEDSRQVARSKEDGSRVIIKRVSKHNAVRAAELRREIAVLTELADPNVGQMHEWLASERSIWLVVDHFPGATLAQLIETRGSVSPLRSKQLFTQLLSGVLYLFYNRIAPLRLCGETVSLNGNSDLVISDLSCAFEYCSEGEVDVEALHTGRYGSDVYVAPEAFDHEPYNARKAVMWSCGVILYLLTTGGTKRLSSLEHPVFQQDPTRRRRFSVSSSVPTVLTYPNRLKVPEWARHIMTKMLEVEPRKRAEFIEVAAQVPKQIEGEKLRPLMEMAWLDYKSHVGPGGASGPFSFGDPAYESSLYSTNTTTGLLGGRSRLMSTGW